MEQQPGRSLGTGAGRPSWECFCPGGSQFLQPVCAALLAHRPVVPGIRRRGGSGHFWEPHRHLDHPGSQAHADGDQLLPGEPGLLRRLHGCFQHPHQLHLRAAQRVVLWGGLLPLPQLLPHHSCLRQHLLHDGDCRGQVRKERKSTGVRDWDQICCRNKNSKVTTSKWREAESSIVHGLCSSPSSGSLPKTVCLSVFGVSPSAFHLFYSLAFLYNKCSLSLSSAARCVPSSCTNSVTTAIAQGFAFPTCQKSLSPSWCHLIHNDEELQRLHVKGGNFKFPSSLYFCIWQRHLPPPQKPLWTLFLIALLTESSELPGSSWF